MEAGQKYVRATATLQRSLDSADLVELLESFKSIIEIPLMKALGAINCNPPIDISPWIVSIDIPSS